MADVDEWIRDVVGSALNQDELDALLRWYAGLSQAVAAFPEADLKRVEPPLRSVPGPR